MAHVSTAHVVTVSTLSATPVVVITAALLLAAVFAVLLMSFVLYRRSSRQSNGLQSGTRV